MSQEFVQHPDIKGGNFTIADLYPGLTPEQQADAEYRLLGYLSIAKRIFVRVCREEPDILTELERRATLTRQRRTREKGSP